MSAIRVELGECPLDLVPLDEDVLSMELPDTFKELYVVSGGASRLWTVNILLTWRRFDTMMVLLGR